MASASRDSEFSRPVLAPWTVRSRTRRRTSSDVCIAVPAVVSQLSPSAMLRECCSLARRPLRSDIAAAVPEGSSDGLAMFFMPESLFCSPDIAARLCCMLVSVERCTVCCVTRPIMVISPRFRCG
jgi:hypothetical protein